MSDDQQYAAKSARQEIRDLEAKLARTRDPETIYLIESRIETIAEEVTAYERGEL